MVCLSGCHGSITNPLLCACVLQQETTEVEEQAPAQVELLGSFYSLITSVEQLQSNFLLTPDKYSEGELATPPRKLLNSLRYSRGGLGGWEEWGGGYIETLDHKLACAF